MKPEIDVFGVYFAPFAGDLLIALLIFLPVRRFCAARGVFAPFWHAALVELCLFVLVLSLTAYFA